MWMLGMLGVFTVVALAMMLEERMESERSKRNEERNRKTR